MVQMDNNGLRTNIEETLQVLKALQLNKFEFPGQMLKIREDQVPNNAGGFVFQIDDLSSVRRFLILGTSGGTYYTTEQELTIENVSNLINLIKKGKGGMILTEILEISLAGRAPKQDPLLFALALCARYSFKMNKSEASESEETEEDESYIAMQQKYFAQLNRAAFLSVNKVCRIPTHLFMFVHYCDVIAKTIGHSDSNHAGWGRSMRKCISEWYLTKKPMELALHITKYKKRSNYSHRDLLRLSHAMAVDNHSPESARLTLLFDQIFCFACTDKLSDGKYDTQAALKPERCNYLPTHQMVEEAKSSDAIKFLTAVQEVSKLGKSEADEKKCAELILKHGLVREHIPTDLLNSAQVWIALLHEMPMMALIRNLSKLSTLGIITGENPQYEKHLDSIIKRLSNQDALKKARIHPISLLLAASVYNKGCGVRGSLHWKVNDQIKKALDEAFLLSFGNVQPTGKRYCVGVDVSGSMGWTNVSNSVLSCREASAAICAVFLRTETQVECMAFQDKFVSLPFNKETSVEHMMKYCEELPFGSTDCSLPMLWATEQQKKFDVFVVLTDNETWCGNVQPFVALRTYREKSGIADAKLVVLAMSSTQFTIADPTDRGMIDIVGLDSAVPELIRSFVLNEM